MITIVLVVLAIWVLVGAMCMPSLLWQFRLYAFSAAMFAIAGLRLLLQEPWGDVIVPNIGGDAKAQAGAGIAHIVVALGPNVVGFILLGAALYLARDAKFLLGELRDGNRTPIR